MLVLLDISQKTEKWACNFLAALAASQRTMTVQHYLHWDFCGWLRLLRLPAMSQIF